MTQYEAAMARIKERFLARSREDLVQFRAFLRDRSVVRSEVARLAHRLAGSAGIFGFKTLSALAKSVDGELLQETPEVPESFPRLVDALESLLAAEACSSDGTVSESLGPQSNTAAPSPHERHQR